MADCCPCGGIILADTEDWRIPICYDCWVALGSPETEPTSDQLWKRLEELFGPKAPWNQPSITRQLFPAVPINEEKDE